MSRLWAWLVCMVRHGQFQVYRIEYPHADAELFCKRCEAYR